MHRGTEENAEGRMFISKNKSTAAHNTEQFYYRLRIKGAPTNAHYKFVKTNIENSKLEIRLIPARVGCVFSGCAEQA